MILFQLNLQLQWIQASNPKLQVKRLSQSGQVHKAKATKILQC